MATKKDVRLHTVVRKAIDATKPLLFVIRKDDAARANEAREKHLAIPGNTTDTWKRVCGCMCVIAQGVAQSVEAPVSCEVGSSVVKIRFSGGKVVRYGTTAKLRKGLKNWDETGDWLLKAGAYTLPILPKSARLGGRPNRPFGARGIPNGSKFVKDLKTGEIRPARGVRKTFNPQTITRVISRLPRQ